MRQQIRRRTRRHIQRRATSFFEFGLPSPPWMAYTFGQKMHAVTITQNRSNYWTGFSVLMALGLLIVSAVGMIVSWPIEMTFEWILFSILFLGALVLGGNYVYWLFLPRNAVFSVSAEQIRIEDQPVFKWVTRTFSPSEVVEISYSSESGSRLKTRDGKVYILSDVIMMQRAAIFAAIAAQHPHIALKGNHQPNKPEMATPSKPSDLI